jgi:hypothetical protein
MRAAAYRVWTDHLGTPYVLMSELPDLQKSSHVSDLTDEGGGWNKST